MRAIDRSRLLALHAIKMNAKTILELANDYQKSYHSEKDSASEIMDTLDRIWGLIVVSADAVDNEAKREL